MTGERISAEEAYRIGLVQELVEDVEEGMVRARAMAERVSRNSPTAVAAFKRACLDSVGRSAAEGREIEALAYEHCVTSGEAAIGRANFSQIRKGEPVEWGEMSPFKGG